MNKLKLFVLLVSLVAFGALLAACAMPTPQVVERVVVVTPTPEPEARKLEIFHWWTAPGEREAADAMFAALKAAYPDIEVIE
ncbi:MAG: hypothetical protein NZP34_13645, partial [Caldilineales bacterium]|nr:hypothetical protein [Caldilineales bacterium]